MRHCSCQIIYTACEKKPTFLLNKGEDFKEDQKISNHNVHRCALQNTISFSYIFGNFFQVSSFVYFGLILSIFVAQGAHGAKILGVFPLPGKSHFAVSSSLMKELANRGHQVTVVSPFPEKSPVPNYTDIDTRSTREFLLQSTGTSDYLNKLY